MPQERLTIDNISSQTNLTGSITDIDDDPDSPDGLWITTINGGSGKRPRLKKRPHCGRFFKSNAMAKLQVRELRCECPLSN